MDRFSNQAVIIGLGETIVSCAVDSEAQLQAQKVPFRHALLTYKRRLQNLHFFNVPALKQLQK